MTITDAQWVYDDDGTKIGISAVINGTPHGIPLDPLNRHYAEILRQVDEGLITVKE